ncbi:hypothetical protein GIW81_08195 [Hyphomicrobium sp. xq]|uniref:Lipoprotein n=1 Tax=Hyphomicrobium album TaxID=2665159 RepID=A0A6I3KFF8_9HYPH|nr:hypothetical protein [Hyphomicrobium album]MTD94315.1 hypothetical protein [Hyphomicrobium album]
MPPRSRLLPLLAAGLTLAMAGCGTDDIQLNGGIFDAVGLNDAKKSGDPKLAERAPLVVPPSLDRLPAPGEAPPPTQIAGINDPDAAKQKSREELEKQHAEYCEKNYDDPMRRGEEVSMVEGPLGPCRRSVLTAIKKWNAEEDTGSQ